MPDFHPDWSPVAEPPSAANPIALAHIATLQVLPEWTEAVAVVEELCATILAGGAPFLIPDAEDVSITAYGTVLIRTGAPGSERITELGRILHALLDSVTTPAPVRLFVAHAIGSGPYSSVEEFAQALSYYGPPNREELIRALYARLLLAPAPADPLAADPPPEDEPRTPPARRRSPLWIALGALAVVSLCVTALWTWSAAGPTSIEGLQTSLTAVTDAVLAQLSGPADAAAPEDEQAAGSGGLAGGPAPPPVRRSPPRGAADGGLARAETGGPASLPAAPILEGALAEAPVVSQAPPAATVPPDPTVYPMGSPGVEPPVMVSPQLPPFPLDAPFAPGTNTMELLVDEDGRVEQVHLVSQPVRLPDMTLLSAAKTWRFHPAQKDGHPVRYRLALSWTVSPP